MKSSNNKMLSILLRLINSDAQDMNTLEEKLILNPAFNEGVADQGCNILTDGVMKDLRTLECKN